VHYKKGLQRISQKVSAHLLVEVGTDLAGVDKV